MSSLDSLGRTKSSRSRAGIPSTASRLSDFVKSLIAIDSKPPFHLPRRKRQPRGSDETLDKVFQGLLKEANRELASLLRDVHSGPHTDLLDGAESQAIRDLLRRANVLPGFGEMGETARRPSGLRQVFDLRTFNRAGSDVDQRIPLRGGRE